jgi:hypothetical protein
VLSGLSLLQGREEHGLSDLKDYLSTLVLYTKIGPQARPDFNETGDG